MIHHGCRRMSALQKIILCEIFLAALLFSSYTVEAQEPTPALEDTPSPISAQPLFTPADLIAAINQSRISGGLAPLAVHPILMQIAQTEANGIAAGYGGHWRPPGLNLATWMLSLGYPLSGDLSLGGYCSEGWISLPMSATADDVFHIWNSDAEHANVMESDHRSDIGAGVAVGEDGYVVGVIETALQTSSGKMQYDAYAILTGIPQTQAAYYGMKTEAAKNGLPVGYMMPVEVNAAEPNGDVYHVALYGQTLWSIAIAYNTTIEQIQSLNRLSDTAIFEGQKLLVVRGATQPAPTASNSVTPDTPMVSTALPTQFHGSTQSPIPAPANVSSANDNKSTLLSFGAIVIAALFLGGMFTTMNRKRQ